MSTGDRAGAPIFFFAPFVSSTIRVEPTWIDYNGHMNMAFYHVLFDRAVEEAFGLVGFGPHYVESRESSFFTAEAHTQFKRELTVQDAVRTTVQLVDYDQKSIHYYLEIRHAEEGWVAATSENLSVHVDTTSRAVVPFPTDILRNLDVMHTAHRLLARPSSLGRVIGLASAGERVRPRERLRARH